MNYMSIKKCDIANGEGIRVSLFVSGCEHYCKNCFNSEAWDFNSGKLFSTDTLNELVNSLDNENISGLTLLGGEPLHPNNQDQVLEILKIVKNRYPKKNIWCYTGYVIEDLLDENKPESKLFREIINFIDILVDGKFDESLHSKKLKFKGSSNQRIIDVPQTIKAEKIILWD